MKLLQDTYIPLYTGSHSFPIEPAEVAVLAAVLGLSLAVEHAADASERAW